MRSGLTFNGVHCNSLGVGMKSINRQILPSTRDTYLEIPGRDGSYLFPGAENDRFIEVEIGITTTSLTDRQQKARQVAAWLRTKARAPLIFDDEPDKKYMAKVANQIDLEMIARAGKVKVLFRCLPFALAGMNQYNIEHLYDTGLDYDTGLIYPNPTGFSFLYKKQGFSTFNYGHVEAKPTITITGVCSNPTITNVTTGKVLTWTGTLLDGEVLTINLENYTAKKGAANALSAISGDFEIWALAVGENKISFESVVTPNATVSVDYNHKFL